MICFQTPYSGAFNQDQAKEAAQAQWGAIFIDINEHEEDKERYLRLYFVDDAAVKQADTDAFVAHYDPTALSSQQQAATEADQLAANLRDWFPTADSTSGTLTSGTTTASPTTDDKLAALVRYLQLRGDLPV